jgi:hypothetical protein
MFKYETSLLKRLIAMKSLGNPIVMLMFVAGLFSCSKEVSELPAPTETGANTFGAMVEGSFFVPQSFGPIPGSSILEAHYAPGRDLYINARNFAASPNEKEFELFIKNVTTPGTYQLNGNAAKNSTVASYGYYVKRNLTPQNEWITTPNYTGSVTFTRVDTINKIVSGTFQFSAINLYNAPQPLTVTEGRFDIKVQ